MNRISRLVALLKTGLALVLIGLVLMSCVNIALRYLFKVNWLAADEIQVFVMVAIACLGAIVASAEGRQLRLDLVGQLAGRRGRTLLALLEAFVTMLVCGFVAFQSWAFVARAYAMGQRGGSSGIPMWIAHSSVTLCFGALTLLGLLKLVDVLRSGRPGRHGT